MSQYFSYYMIQADFVFFGKIANLLLVRSFVFRIRSRFLCYLFLGLIRKKNGIYSDRRKRYQNTIYQLKIKSNKCWIFSCRSHSFKRNNICILHTPFNGSAKPNWSLFPSRVFNMFCSRLSQIFSPNFVQFLLSESEPLKYKRRTYRQV